jgi:uroporphyrinogen-III decarboxylase
VSDPIDQQFLAALRLAEVLKKEACEIRVRYAPSADPGINASGGPWTAALYVYGGDVSEYTGEAESLYAAALALVQAVRHDAREVLTRIDRETVGLRAALDTWGEP